MYAVTASAASASGPVIPCAARAPGRVARRSSPSVAIPAAPTATATGGSPSGATRSRNSRTSGSSNSRKCPASIPRAEVRTGCEPLTATASPGAPAGASAARSPEPPESTPSTVPARAEVPGVRGVFSGDNGCLLSSSDRVPGLRRGEG
ncbi:hypothetical protein SFR_0393 [Streptomyces sp. FR-008]|nr:hypothetical protein SFR_0393 [Streptomyces sp. FR-008]